MNESLLADYQSRYDTVLTPIAERLEALIKSHLDGTKHIDRVAARAKKPDRFVAKADKLDGAGKQKYSEPYVQIQDQIGARVIVYYQNDIPATEEVLRRYLLPIEIKTLVPDSEWEFGYFGKHFIMTLPPDVVPKGLDTAAAPSFFELQLKTLFQHAWSEAEHDLGYKPPEDLSAEQKRLLAFTSAQAWGADNVFERLVAELGPH